ncbi:MAG TPA: hypothetical protein VKW78_17780 [Terriglobales bacterium]|nr:hypothetical protein [Terriglobales bacterium]
MIVIIALFAVTAILFLYWNFRRERILVRTLEDLSGQTRPVDFAAFNNLVDNSQELFLKERLAPSQYRKIRRARLLATLDYVKRLAHNARVLMRLGEAARTSSDAQVAAAAQKLVNDALHMRLLAVAVMSKIYAELVLPQMSTSLDPITERYRELTEAAALLARLQRPAFAGRVAAML